jgi:succinyl-CoA synthetase beta subunit
VARLPEFQAKRLLQDVGVRIPEGDVACSPEEALAVAARIGKPVAVKAQIWRTGRLKAGGVQFASDPKQAKESAARLLGSTIKGFDVQQVLVEEKLDIQSEYYAGVIVDDSYKVRAPVVVFSTEGGVEIEEVATTCPEKVARMPVDIRFGLLPYHARDLVLALEVSGSLLTPISQAICSLYELFRRHDAQSAEINPLVVTTDGQLLAADCRVSIDDASVPRHPELGISVPRESDRPPTRLEQVAWNIEEDDYRGVSFFSQFATEIREEGYVGYHAIGGGGALLAADTLTRHGLKLANFAETSGNPTASKVYRCAKIILSQPGIAGYCLMGAVIGSQDQWHHAHGLVKAFREELADRQGFPVVILLAGNKEEEALQILEDGTRDLPIRLELYGRDHIEDLDSVAGRLKALVDEYQASGSQ